MFKQFMEEYVALQCAEIKALEKKFDIFNSL